MRTNSKAKIKKVSIPVLYDGKLVGRFEVVYQFQLVITKRLNVQVLKGKK